MEKKQIIIDKINSLNNSFDLNSILDYQKFLELFYLIVIKEKEQDKEIINALLALYLNILNKDIENCKCINNFLDFSLQFQKSFNSKIINPLNPSYNYLNFL